jgi:hypothetical protein
MGKPFEALAKFTSSQLKKSKYMHVNSRCVL